MLRELIIGAWLVAICTACEATPKGFDWSNYQPPDWRKYQAKTFVPPVRERPTGQSRPEDSAAEQRFTFRDLKTESDESLARRLLGEAGKRIAYVDRKWHRWAYYDGDGASADSIDLYTHPYALGSQFGLCGVERYSIEFDEGRILSVAVSERYGVEGPIFQKSGFDWDHYRNVMCASAPAAHAPSYFPATDSLMADDAAALLVILFDLASSPGPLPFPLECRTWRGKEGCSRDPRSYLGALRLNDIDEFSLVNCPLADRPPNSLCFTITTGEHEIGPFPKYITVKGSTYLHRLRLDSVEVIEGSTIS